MTEMANCPSCRYPVAGACPEHGLAVSPSASGAAGVGSEPPQSLIYIVTQSDDYYPCAAAEDWKLVTRDREGALARARGLYDEIPDRLTGPGKVGSVHVLAINEDNLHVQEIDWANTVDKERQ